MKITFTYNKGASSTALTQIAYSASDSSTRRKILQRAIQCEDFRLDFSFANGSISNPVKIRSIFISGHFIVDK